MINDSMKKLITVLIIGLMLPILVSGCVQQDVDIIPDNVEIIPNIENTEDVSSAIGDVTETIDDISNVIEDVNENLG